MEAPIFWRTGAGACRFMAEFKKTLEGWDREIG
jgi:hypothetical protein